MQVKLSDGRVFSGTGLQIVQGMKGLAPFSGDRTIGEYIDWVCSNVAVSSGVELLVAAGTDDERCEWLIDGLVGAGLAELLQ